MAIETRCPTGDGALLEWDPAGPTTHWDLVDDCGVPDEDATFISSSTAGKRDLATFGAFTINAGIVANVTVRYRARIASGAQASVRPMLRVNGIDYLGVAEALTTSWVSYAYAWTTNPDTAVDWINDDVNGSGPNPLQQIGIKLESTMASTTRVTEYRVEASFTPVEVGPVYARTIISQPDGRIRSRLASRIARQYFQASQLPPAELVEEDIPPGWRSLAASWRLPDRLTRPRLAAGVAYQFRRYLEIEEQPAPEGHIRLTSPPQRLMLRKRAAHSAYQFEQNYMVLYMAIETPAAEPLPIGRRRRAKLPAHWPPITS